VKKIAAFLTLCLIIHTSKADQLSGRVISIADGDTLTILDENKQRVVIRLNAIDAPEKNQAFSNASKKSLSLICFKKAAKVETFGIDKYGRTIGDVTCSDINANQYQVDNGMAWVYRKYSNDHTLITLEAQAKNIGLGLWDDPNPVPPWEFRHRPIISPAPVAVQKPTGSGFSCGYKRYCKQMVSCEEARYYLEVCGVYRLDRDNDGVPCESIC
jgi:endonuclease YncB( thermonuclease family)